MPKRPNLFTAAPGGLYLGVDPGASGGLAATEASGAPLDAVAMPATDRDVLDFLTSFRSGSFAVLEKVGGYVSTEGAQPGSAMFKFGASYGGLRMALTALGIPYVEVPPQTWQKGLVSPRGKWETKTAWKNRLKAKAQALFPSVTVTLATADALLIADYARRYRLGIANGTRG